MFVVIHAEEWSARKEALTTASEIKYNHLMIC